MNNRLHRVFSSKQLYAYAVSNSRYNFFDGAVRSGKTHVSYWRWAKFVRYEAPQNGDLVIIGRTQSTAERNVIYPMMKIFGEKRLRYASGSGRGYFFNRPFYVVGANDEAAKTKIQGSTVAGALGDEVVLWPESFFTMLQSRMSLEGSKFFGTMNPDGPMHWMKKLIDRRDELDICYIHFELHDNKFLPKNFAENISKEYTGLWYKRFVLGLWCAAEGAIYDMWDEARHVKVTADLVTEGYMLVDQCVAVDYGTANPTAALLSQAYRLPDKKARHIHVAAEYYYSGRDAHKQKTDAQYIKDFRLFYEQHGLDISDIPLVIDPSASSLKVAAKQAGFMVRDADNAVLDGIRVVSTRLGADDLTIDPSCQHLRMEIASYVWDPKAQEKGEDKPKKENDHACDALRYGVKRLHRERFAAAQKPAGW